jgi:hypothetical protein
MEFDAQVLVVDRFLFQAIDHLAHSAAVLVAEGTANVNSAFAAEFDARPDFEAVVGFGSE